MVGGEEARQQKGQGLRDGSLSPRGRDCMTSPGLLHRLCLSIGGERLRNLQCRDEYGGGWKEGPGPQRKQRDQAGFRPSSLDGECAEPIPAGAVLASVQLGPSSAKRARDLSSGFSRPSSPPVSDPRSVEVSMGLGTDRLFSLHCPCRTSPHAPQGQPQRSHPQLCERASTPLQVCLSQPCGSCGMYTPACTGLPTVQGLSIFSLPCS